MIYRLLTYLVVSFWIAAPAMAQVDTTRTDSAAADTNQAPTDTTAADTTEDVLELQQWEHPPTIGMETSSTDSTLRWQNWPDWVDKKNRDAGVITYRLGTQNRNSGMMINAHEARYQNLYWENISLNDPANNMPHYSFIPLEKVKHMQEQTNGLEYESRFHLRQYYLNKPLSTLSYTEGANNFRNMEFMVSQNINQRTNTEISYRDERENSGYSNFETSGQQIYARISHFLDNEQLIKAHYLNNSYDNDESFGYQIQDMQLFNPNENDPQPTEPSAESDLSGSNLGVNYYRRAKDTVSVAHNFRAGLSMNTVNRSVKASEDTTSYKIRALGADARKWFSTTNLSVETGLEYRQHFNLDQASLDTNNWGAWRADALAAYETPVPFLNINGGAEIAGRTDGYQEYALNARGKIEVDSLMSIKGGVASGTKMPSPQQLYWSSMEYSGNETLQNEFMKQAFGEVELRLSRPFLIGIKSQIKDIDQAIMVDEDNQFSNIDRYNSLSITPYARFTSSHFEIDGSATYHQYGNWLGTSSEALPVDSNRRVWLKGSAYVKGYLFNRATYVKAGFSGMMAPFRYRAEQYNPILNNWQPSAEEQPVPIYNRLDADLSARVRSIMVLLRYENVLDEVAQLGYFETANYPMPARRFMVGIRVLFRN